MGCLVVNNAMTINGAFEAPSPDEWFVFHPDAATSRWTSSWPLEWAPGPRIFDDIGPIRLKPIGSTTFPSGVVRLAYRPPLDQQDDTSG